MGRKTHPFALAKLKYARHKAQAKYRSIDFNFTYEDWYEWWLQNGVDKNIHIDWNGPDRLCMCRYKDQGAYEWNNVYCATHVQNGQDTIYKDQHRELQSRNQQPNYRYGNRIVNAAQLWELAPETKDNPYWRYRYLKKNYAASRARELRQLKNQYDQRWGSRLKRQRYLGCDGWYEARTHAAASYNMSVDKWQRLERDGEPGFATKTVGPNWDEFYLFNCKFPL